MSNRKNKRRLSIKTKHYHSTWNYRFRMAVIKAGWVYVNKL